MSLTSPIRVVFAVTNLESDFYEDFPDCPRLLKAIINFTWMVLLVSFGLEKTYPKYPNRVATLFLETGPSLPRVLSGIERDIESTGFFESKTRLKWELDTILLFWFCSFSTLKRGKCYVTFFKCLLWLDFRSEFSVLVPNIRFECFKIFGVVLCRV